LWCSIFFYVIFTPHHWMHWEINGKENGNGHSSQLDTIGSFHNHKMLLASNEWKFPPNNYTTNWMGSPPLS
jgi:hypothetical protein